MAHRSSPSGLHAAREVLRLYNVTVKRMEDVPGMPPGVLANEVHLSILIDKATNAHLVCAIRPEIRYWQNRLTARTATSRDIDFFLKRVIETLEMVPEYQKNEEPLGYMAVRPVADEYTAGEEIRQQPWRWAIVSKGAYDAMRCLRYWYILVPKNAPLFDGAEQEQVLLAKLIDNSVRISKPVSNLQAIRECRALLLKGDITELDLRKAIRTLGCMFDQVPHYDDLREESMLLV